MALYELRRGEKRGQEKRGQDSLRRRRGERRGGTMVRSIRVRSQGPEHGSRGKRLCAHQCDINATEVCTSALAPAESSICAVELTARGSREGILSKRRVIKNIWRFQLVARNQGRLIRINRGLRFCFSFRGSGQFPIIANESCASYASLMRQFVAHWQSLRPGSTASGDDDQKTCLAICLWLVRTGIADSEAQRRA